MHFDWQFFWKALFTPSDPFVDGLILTIVISVVAMILATLVGLVVALMRRSRFAALRWSASFYIWAIRGTPLLVQLALTTIWTFIQAGIENRLARQLGIEQRVRITQRLTGARRAAAPALQVHG